MKKQQLGDMEKALLGLPVQDVGRSSLETRLALLNVEALHIGDLVQRRAFREAHAIPGLMKYARALRLDGPEAIAFLSPLTLRDFLTSLLRAAIGRPLDRVVADAVDALFAQADAVKVAPAGQKVDRLSEAAQTLAPLMRTGALDEYFVHDELMAAAEKTGLPAPLASRTIAEGIEAGRWRAPVKRERGTPFALAALRQECASVATAPEGERNRALHAASVRLGHLIAGGALAEDYAREQLLGAAARAMLGEREALATIRSGLESGKKQPRAGRDGGQDA